jgi:hypothetical protein
MPNDIGKEKNAQYLGKSEKGISLATICDEDRLRVYNLVESDMQIDWVLKYHVELEPLTSLMWHKFNGFKKTWALDGDGDGVGDDDNDDDDDDNDDNDDDDDDEEEEDNDNNDDDEEEDNDNNDDEDNENNDEDEDNDNDNDDDDDDDDDDDNYDNDDEEDYDDDQVDDDDDGGEGGEEERKDKEGEEGEIGGMQMEENMEWNSDDDNVVNIEDKYCGINIYFLGFHPYKEVVFLGLSPSVGVAYHLRSSKIQYLGNMRPKDYYRAHSNGLYEAYIYTPCLIGELRKHAPRSHGRGE